MMKKQKWILFYGMTSLVITGFIFSNSLQGGAASNAASGGITAFLQSILCDMGITVDQRILHILIRKMAHFVEFFALGLSVGGLAIYLGKKYLRSFLAFPMLLTLLVAVTDEFIQRFTGRTSSVRDVVLDFVGALCGLAVAALIGRLFGRPD